MANRRSSRPQPRINIWANFWKSLIAVVIGNLLYIFVIAPRLPAAGRHHLYHIDLGLVVDFWICLVIYGVIELVLRLKRR
jgi:ABC-type uncharacterized transport system permease subunit